MQCQLPEAVGQVLASAAWRVAIESVRRVLARRSARTTRTVQWRHEREIQARRLGRTRQSACGEFRDALEIGCACHGMLPDPRGSRYRRVSAGSPPQKTPRAQHFGWARGKCCNQRSGRPPRSSVRGSCPKRRGGDPSPHRSRCRHRSGRDRGRPSRQGGCPSPLQRRRGRR